MGGLPLSSPVPAAASWKKIQPGNGERPVTYRSLWADHHLEVMMGSMDRPASEPVGTPQGDGPVHRWVDRWGSVICFVWGFAEGTLFFIIPDVAVGLVGLLRPRRALRAAAWAVAGALVGGLALFVITQAVGQPMLDVINGVPAIPDRMLNRADDDLGLHGGGAMIEGVFVGIPYKVYVVEMALRGWSLLSVLAWTVPARTVRFVGTGLVSAAVGLMLRRLLAQRPRLGLAGYTAVWTLIYVVYWRTTGF
jgi:hypothetical protein